ncbi:hypothetical protein I5907_18660 [Panacibacter sp. DH6]|uniref:Asl1-like glycosyl hydrolase catalytic domain-containing protein n=1 Tax=Panacibacter microcysteis TaxID=2793269 RepID=A0A931GZM2_9BACT|nr:hypothetical protein [Panacibacter microcysteis]MBG9378267.1 hypothetical protein [Panacibacter microcysteis]
MKRTVSFMLVLGCISAVTGCKKETISTVQETTAAAISADVQNAVSKVTNFGVMVADTQLDTDGKITVTDKLGMIYVRNTVILSTYNGKAPVLDDFAAAGYKVILNLNEYAANGGARAFPTNMKEYKNQLNDFLADYQPEVAVIENEPYNDGYYTGPIENYLTQLRTAVDVCKAKGIKVADGALNLNMVLICVYQDFVNKGQQAKADDFANRSGMSGSLVRAAQGKGSADINAKLEKCKKMITAYKGMALDYVNIHWYEPMGENASKSSSNSSAPNVATDVANYLRAATGKDVLTNEFGQTTTTPSLVASQVTEFRKAGLAYAIDYSGTGNGGVNPKPLHKNVNLQPNGVSYRDAVAN